jgi:prepilin-type N-terminal cleavage/methylation domain-containing protein
MISIRRGGFTLVELMTVIVIVGILSAVGMPAYREYVYNSKLAEAYLGVAAVSKGQIIHFSDHHYFTTLFLYSDVAEDGGATSCSCVPNTGSKSPLEPPGSGFKEMGGPLSVDQPTYFAYVTFGAYWDNSGSGSLTYYDIDGSFVSNGDISTWGAPDFFTVPESGNDSDFCSPSVSPEDFVTGANDQYAAVTFAAANLKQSNDLGCTYVIQSVVSDDNGTRTSPPITMKE